MHVYGEGGEVCWDFGDGIAVRTDPEDAVTAQSQLGHAIWEARHQQSGQARLFIPTASPPSGQRARV